MNAKNTSVVILSNHTLSYQSSISFCLEQLNPGAYRKSISANSVFALA